MFPKKTPYLCLLAGLMQTNMVVQKLCDENGEAIRKKNPESLSYFLEDTHMLTRNTYFRAYLNENKILLLKDVEVYVLQQLTSP